MLKWQVVRVSLIAMFLCVNSVIAACEDLRSTGIENKGEKVKMDKSDEKDDNLKKRLSALQYYVTQKGGTEPPFQNEYWDNHQDGLYVDIVSGKPLFSSRDKFDSKTGWPSFTKPLEGEGVTAVTDSSHGMVRTEVRGLSSGAHLGHVFDDGPTPEGKRYCINSSSLRFIPVNELEKEGYAKYFEIFESSKIVSDDVSKSKIKSEAKVGNDSCEASVDTAILAGGCFWGVEELIRTLPGVIDVEAGYTGGGISNPSYSAVSSDSTGHAEAVKITYDPSKTNYESILRFFFRLHDPTTKNRQGNDIGTRYRSAIFAKSKQEREVAEKVIKEIADSGKWKKPIATTIEDAGPWWKAEEYHQDYLQKNPGGYTCHFLRE